MPRNTRPNSNPSTSKAPQQQSGLESSDESSDSDQKPQNSSLNLVASNIPVLVTNFVKYIINHSCNKYPIKRADMSKSLNIPPKEFSEVYDEAQEILKEIYGIDLVEVPETKSGKLYMTCSLFTNSSFNAVSEEQRREGLLLFIILSYIFMKGGDIQERKY